MGTWQISADLLARSRFVVSPRIETVAALNDLVRPSDAAGRAFAAAHRESFEEMLAEHPVRRAVLEHSWRPGWISDWLALPPDGPGRTFAEEVDDVRTLGDMQVRACLRESSPETTLPRILTRPGTAEHAAQLLEWVWTHALATDWARRERILRADIVSRTARLATHGWAAVLRDLGRDREWLGDGQLRINRFDLPSRVLDDDADLYFVPAHGTATWVGWHLPRRYAIYYPVTGGPRGGRRPGRRRARAPRGERPGPPAARTRRTIEHERPRRPHGYAARLGGRPPQGPARGRGGAAPALGTRGALLAHRPRRRPRRIRAGSSPHVPQGRPALASALRTRPRPRRRHTLRGPSCVSSTKPPVLPSAVGRCSAAPVACSSAAVSSPPRPPPRRPRPRRTAGRPARRPSSRSTRCPSGPPRSRPGCAAATSTSCSATSHAASTARSRRSSGAGAGGTATASSPAARRCRTTRAAPPSISTRPATRSGSRAPSPPRSAHTSARS